MCETFLSIRYVLRDDDLAIQWENDTKENSESNDDLFFSVLRKKWMAAPVNWLFTLLGDGACRY